MASQTESDKEIKAASAADKKLRNYELVLVITPEATEEEFAARVDSVSQSITSRGGAVASVEPWGKKRLAYPINGFVEGNYVLLRCNLLPAMGRELEANLKIIEDVLRHLLVKIRD